MSLKELDVCSEEIDNVDYELFEEQERKQCLWLEDKALYINAYGIKIRLFKKC